jgi:hypothetical protein
MGDHFPKAIEVYVCPGVIRLGKCYSLERLEDACAQVALTKAYSLKTKSQRLKK